MRCHGQARPSFGGEAFQRTIPPPFQERRPGAGRGILVLQHHVLSLPSLTSTAGARALGRAHSLATVGSVMRASSVILKLESFRTKGRASSEVRLDHMARTITEVEEMRTHVRRLRAASRFVVKPSSRIRQVWDIVVFVAMLYTAPLARPK